MKNPPIIFFAFILHLSASCAQRQVYIVYFGEHNGEKTLREIEDTHYSYLVSVKDSKEEAKASLIYSYKNIINGFSALLTPDEAAKLLEMDEVVSVFHSHPRKYSVQTTRSWDFVNLLDGIGGMNHSNQEELLIKASYGKEAIVGLLDTGIWPQSQSFSDEGMEPIPKSWKGICQHGVAFNSSHCYRKLIGARYYLKGYEAIYGPLNNLENYRSPRDKSGHGTHTASTVGGRRVANASALGGFANGTASGGAPLVRIAMYKVCWQVPGQDQGGACLDDDMLAAFDDAIADGVQVLSVSIVSFNSTPYTEDVIAIGSWHAVKRNIAVACSAGNSGPLSSTVTNVAPWIITVAASSIDRVFTSPVLLGNDMKVEGQTMPPYKLKKLNPLVYAGDAEIPGTTTNATTGRCRNGTLSSKVVEGKIVLCLRGKRNDILKGLEVRRAGGAAIIAVNPINGSGILVNTHLLPGTTIFSNDSATVLNNINNTKSPMATIIPAKTALGSKSAPFMAPFSSWGPIGIEPNILKPDISAPGLNILAAWSEASSPTSLSADHRVTKYNIVSGTSMSCPHVAAAAALLKAIHPDWSSAAIRSTKHQGLTSRIPTMLAPN
ncbi:hypothetical protein F0562_018203 [Nyssa sinensis]|uniref:Inhibitor I9 domain-containing protein n=1 Tax=Nyssa sinensis TaxID=561372 RepID=A0A5J4Z9B9_9ASTE|nr:hypothetical protein F0562_018203 [Nyssa sinensis]